VLWWSYLLALGYDATVCRLMPNTDRSLNRKTCGGISLGAPCRMIETWRCVYDSWWFSIERRDADKQLMLPGNPRGTFLIRNSGGMQTWQTDRHSVNVNRIFRQIIWLSCCFLSPVSYGSVLPRDAMLAWYVLWSCVRQQKALNRMKTTGWEGKGNRKGEGTGSFSGVRGKNGWK